MSETGQSRHFGCVPVTSGLTQLRTWRCIAITDAMCQERKSPLQLDRLVGARKQRRQHFEAKRFRRGPASENLHKSGQTRTWLVCPLSAIADMTACRLMIISRAAQNERGRQLRRPPNRAKT